MEKQETYAFEFRNVTKNFGNICANSNISFQVKKGTIRALIGENGAGKSTAMKILFGLYQEDEGEIVVHGKPQRWKSSKDAIQNGIGMVHQHFMLAHNATGLDNIILGDEKKSVKLKIIPLPFNFLDRQKAKRKILELAKKYGLETSLDIKISKVPVGNQQRIEILKLLYRNAEILILDEPTAVLTPLEVTQLFENLKKLKNEGKTIIIVTHKLNEVLNISDDITVFRAGKIVGEIKTSEATENRIASLMIGRDINLHPNIPRGKVENKSVLKIENLCLLNPENKKQNLLSNIHLNLFKGEIVGIAGVEGNGQSELIDIIFHAQNYFQKKLFQEPLASGSLHVLDTNVTKKNLSSNADIRVGFIPEDRHKNGLLLNMTVKENFILGRQHEKSFLSGYFLNDKKIQSFVQNEIEKFDVRPRDINLKIDGFSGGNQQKIIIAREFGKNPHMIIAANPTRGVDIGSIEFIHEQIIAQRDRGVGVLLISSELDEIFKLSDRILVMYEGKIVAQFERGQSNEHELGLAMCGGLGK